MTLALLYPAGPKAILLYCYRSKNGCSKRWFVAGDFRFLVQFLLIYFSVPILPASREIWRWSSASYGYQLCTYFKYFMVQLRQFLTKQQYTKLYDNVGHHDSHKILKT